MKPFTEEDRYLYDLTPDSWVVDGGAHKGTFTTHIVNRYGCRVHAFEPVHEYYERLVGLYDHDKRVFVTRGVLGSSKRTAPVKIYHKGDSSGEFADGECEFAPPKSYVDIEYVHGIGKMIDLLKLNIEGGEFEFLEDILECGKAKWLFRNIQVQFHPVVPDAEARYQAIRAALLKTHHLTFDAPWVWQNYRLNT